ncbi:cell division protein ZapA [Granulicella rosea]|uniref:Cell division protein ZapA n=1 Tax=Granulicella rosea TaxID=474952 RepID=A0A239KQH1_9BACT|nr:cell division protein ZapA [Granulicella rosea]SNT20295.1 cell division protein ZapA [Granulicella rosea]
MNELQDNPPVSAFVNQDATSVEIYDQIYHLRGTDAAYIERLAGMVDAKMRAVAAQGGTVDSLRVAVLASLNMADELEMMRRRYETLAGSLVATESTMRTRSASLAGMLDEVLDDHDNLLSRRAG